MSRIISFIIGISIFAFFISGAALAGECSKAVAEGKAHFAKYHLGKNEFDLAQAAYLDAAKDPACAYEAYWRLADLHLCWGTTQKSKDAKIAVFQQGIAYAEKAIEANPNKPEGHYQYCVNQGSIIDIEGAMKNLMKVRKIKKANDTALSLNPNYAPALTVDARFAIDMPGVFGGSKKKGEDQLRKALKASPDFETTYNELAAFLIKEKRFAEAKSLLEKLTAPDFHHEAEAPWLTIDKPKALELKKSLEPAGEIK